MKDYYSLLGIDSNASKGEIKKNYRLLATKFHPDKNSDPDAAPKFVAITEAYDVLSNRKNRTQYDLLRWEALKNEQVTPETFSAVVPPAVSLRTRRNLAQQKRSLLYHKANSKFKKASRLLVECFYILSRYVYHILGTSLLVFILGSVLSEVGEAFESGLAYGIPVFILILVILYALFKILENAYFEFIKDIKAFSYSYKLSQNKARLSFLTVFVCVIFLYLAILQAY